MDHHPAASHGFEVHQLVSGLGMGDGRMVWSSGFSGSHGAVLCGEKWWFFW